ncbi:MAG: UDP-N-acetylmuramate dehydrogenase [Enterobacteriaceae bacterium]
MFKSLKNFHTFSEKVYSYDVVIVYTKEELLYFYKRCLLKKIPFIILGEGSNILFLKNYYGLVVINRIFGISIMERKKYYLVNCNSGEKWRKLVNICMYNKIYGLENLAFIPGCVGSAVIHNIGAYGMEIKKFCKYVEVINLLNGNIYKINKKLCDFKYRGSLFKNIYFGKYYAVLSVCLKITKNWFPCLLHKELFFLKNQYVSSNYIYSLINKIRKKKIPNPKFLGNAGSFFKNPVVEKMYINKYKNVPFKNFSKNSIILSASYMIDKCYLKGLKIGNSFVYKYNPLIIVSYPNNKKSNSIIKLAKYIHLCVFKKFSVNLEPEVRFISYYGEINSYNFLKNMKKTKF